MAPDSQTSNSQTRQKQIVADAALDVLPDSGTIGLGSGSTAELFIRGVGKLVAAGRELTGVATSRKSRDLAESLGIPLLGDEGPWEVDVCVDGADEVSPQLDLIKGGGACHTREKIVNASAKHNVIVVDDSKLTTVLGERWPVPVEVLSFGHQATKTQLERFGLPSLRTTEASAEPLRTDAGNYIYDVAIGPITDPAVVNAALRALPGVVETGLFVRRADVVLVSGGDGLRTLKRQD